MNDKIRIGIVGIGGAGRGHLRRFNKDKRVRVTAIMDTNKTRSYEGIPIYRDFNLFLSNVDAVSVCTPDMHHLEYCVESLKNGKHVLVEKPMVGSVEQAKMLEQTIKQHSEIVFGVHHQMRYVPAFFESKRLLNEVSTGPVFEIEANYWHNMRERNTQFDDWRIKGKGQSLLFGAACHPLDLLIWLLDGEEIEDFAIYTNHLGYPEYNDYTNSTFLLRFSSGTIGKINVNNCVRFPQLNDLFILGENGTIINGCLFTNEQKRIHKINLYGGIFGPIKNLGCHLLEKVGSISNSFRYPMFSRYDHETACQRIIQNFISAIYGNEEIWVPFADGYRVIQILEKIESKALKQNQR